MKIKDFYLKYMFNDYVKKMPKWLKKVAQNEMDYISDFGFRHIYYLILKNTNHIKIADIGAGDCRVFKALPDFVKHYDYIKKYAYDIFELQELPKDFISFLNEQHIKYFTINKNEKYILKLKKKFDVIICLGTDCHLTDEECNQYINECKNHLKKQGVLVWQTLRNDTIRALMMKYFSKIKYYTRTKQWYRKYFNDEPYPTKISQTYIYHKI